MPGECYFCSGKVVHHSNGGDGLKCNCGAWGHKACLEKRGLIQEESGGLLSSGGLKTKCPNCGSVASI